MNSSFELIIGQRYVVPGHGVCLLESIGHPAVSASNPDKLYCSFSCDDGSGSVHIPEDRAQESIRQIMTREEAVSLIKSIPGVKIPKRTDYRKNLDVWKTALGSGEPEALLSLIMEIWKKEKTARGRTPSVSESKVMRDAQEAFHRELAIALGVEPGEVPSAIQEILGS